MNAGSGHVCVSRGVHRIFQPSLLSFIFCPWGRQGGWKNTLLYLKQDSYGVCPICPPVRDFFIRGRNILFRILSKTHFWGQIPLLFYIQRNICPLCLYAAHASACVCVCIYVYCIYMIAFSIEILSCEIFPSRITDSLCVSLTFPSCMIDWL